MSSKKIQYLVYYVQIDNIYCVIEISFTNAQKTEKADLQKICFLNLEKFRTHAALSNTHIY